VCFLKGGFHVYVHTTRTIESEDQIRQILNEENNLNGFQLQAKNIEFVRNLPQTCMFDCAIILTKEIADEKLQLIKAVENLIPADVPVAVNSESFSLDQLQHVCRDPERLLIANWAEPANTTFFLEIVCNENTDEWIVTNFCSTARKYLRKDPYIVRSGFSVRSRLLSALVREAFYLINEGYATVEDIDRACRNDAGYYLPFAGNFRYMDLMGTYAYGLVMKDLNPELATISEIPKAFTGLFAQQNDSGKELSFYKSTEDELGQRKVEAREFSYKINKLMQQFPFGELADKTEV
jgi:3-hydroxybutyryl-CoA dehydrogenase